MDETGYKGTLEADASLGGFNAQLFLVRQILAKANFSTLVKVVAVTNTGGVAAVGFVDVQPLVNQTDGYGNAIPFPVVHHIPYFRLQGGANAVILDPQVGDIGIAVFAQQDISKVKAIKAQSNPGSARRNSLSDGLYLGGVLNGVPSQYVQFTASGITILSSSAVTIQAPNVTVNASTSATVNTATAEINATTSTTITSPATHITGTLQVGGAATFGATVAATGAVSSAASVADPSGTMAAMRAAYNSHTETVSGVQSGTSTITTSTPTPQM